MDAQLKSFLVNSLLKNSSLRTSKSATEEELMNAVITTSTEMGNDEIESKEVNESKKKSNISKECFCAPTTHEGSFRCRLHRKKLVIDDKNSLGDGIVQFKPQMPKFGRVPIAQVGTHDSLIKQKLSRTDSV